jgi:Adenylate and Guanylate cyclase catalytic domain
LDLVAAVSGLKTLTTLQTRVGIATGLVVVGDLIGSGEAQERGIVGETPNLAARLQGIVEPNTVVIAEGTRRLLGNLFELQDLEAKDLKGITGPVQAWAALRASSAKGRFEAVKFGRTVSSISFSRNAASYFPRPRLRSQTTMSITAPTIGGGVHHLVRKRQCPVLCGLCAIQGCAKPAEVVRSLVGSLRQIDPGSGSKS